MFDVNDIIGKKFNEWVVVEYDGFKVVGNEGKKERKRHFYICKCSCGEIRSVQRANIIKSISKSCGHKNRESLAQSAFKHGLSRDRLFRIYNEMIKRCANEKSKDYPRYGGRGIEVCDDWLSDFNLFRNWAYNNGYENTLSIERVNVDGNYEPSNCKWAGAKEQSLNRRNSVLMNAISPEGNVFQEVNDIYGFCKEHDLSPSKVYECMKGKYEKHKGWRFEKINE